MNAPRFHRLARILALAALLAPAAAEARNPHCAGGIQYVVGGLRDKTKGLTEDYQRQMNKAVHQLELCRKEDPNDFEALGYLGWAYAELDSAGPAGRAFQQAIDGLTAKGDRKKADWAAQNRDSYWATALNEGIAQINEAQAAYPEFTKKPENEADQTLRGEAEKKYQAALVKLTQASLYRPNHGPTLRNLGSVYAFMGDFRTAMAVFQTGLAAAPDDSTLQMSMKTVRTNYANQLIDEKKFDDAIAYFKEMTAAEPANADLWLGLASAQYSRAQARDAKTEADARKADFCAAAESYAKAAGQRADDADLPFNAALSYQFCGDHAKAEAQWREALKRRPNDPEILSALAETLAELKKYDDAIALLRQALLADPKNKGVHRQLGAVYNKAGNSAKSTEELLMYLSLNLGKTVEDPAGAARAMKAGSAAANTLASMGVPDQVNRWEGDGQKYETWYYWSKSQAIHFGADGTMAAKSDWSTTAAAARK